MKQPLVSIITPCYNGEEFVGRFLDSVLAQTYKNIELIIINDGSTDKTEEIILSYQEKMRARGIQFIYLYQENKGQATALNQGLKIFKGDYLTWPDSDDILHENYLSTKVQFLEKNIEIGLVISKCRILKEYSLQRIGTLERLHSDSERENLFYDLIMEKNVFFAPGGYMARSKDFFEVNQKRFIYESQTGQNWQMLLPIAYSFPHGYIDEYLYDYIVREDSHSRREKSESEILQKYVNHEETLLAIVDEMDKVDKISYQKIIKEKYIQKRFNLAFKFNNQELLEKEYSSLKEKDLLNKKILLKYSIVKYQPLNFLFNFAKKIVKLIKGNK